MIGHTGVAMPDAAVWRFDEIAEDDPQRAERLERANDSNRLVADLLSSLASAFKDSALQVALEEAERAEADTRAVIQMPVSVDLFDCFFNSRSGYRAHFCVSPDAGLSLNARIIQESRSLIEKMLPAKILGRRLNHEFKDCGDVEIERAHLVRSLHPRLSKIWLCGKRIIGNGQVELLPIGLGAKIAVRNSQWLALLPENAWLEIKGAFVGCRCVYQPKSPQQRAEKLFRDGLV